MGFLVYVSKKVVKLFVYKPLMGAMCLVIHALRRQGLPQLHGLLG